MQSNKLEVWNQESYQAYSEIMFGREWEKTFPEKSMNTIFNLITALCA